MFAHQLANSIEGNYLECRIYLTRINIIPNAEELEMAWQPERLASRVFELIEVEWREQAHINTEQVNHFIN